MTDRLFALFSATPIRGRFRAGSDAVLLVTEQTVTGAGDRLFRMAADAARVKSIFLRRETAVSAMAAGTVAGADPHVMAGLAIADIGLVSLVRKFDFIRRNAGESELGWGNPLPQSRESKRHKGKGQQACNQCLHEYFHPFLYMVHTSYSYGRLVLPPAKRPAFRQG